MKVKDDHYRLIGVYLLVVGALIVWLLTGCTVTKYVPVETVRTDTLIWYVNIRDSVFQHDSIHVKEKGDTMLVERWHIRYRDRWQHDTIYRSSTDSIRVPVPVERELSKWERFCIDWGQVTLGGSVACLVLAIGWLIVWIRRRV